MVGLYERAIAEAAKRRFAGDQNAESALQSFWSGYADTLVCPLTGSRLRDSDGSFPANRGSRRRITAGDVPTRSQKCSWLRRGVGTIHQILGTVFHRTFFCPLSVICRSEPRKEMKPWMAEKSSQVGNPYLCSFHL